MQAVRFRHDPGCEYGRGEAAADGNGHSDAARRVADTYNLHRIAGTGLGLHNVGKVFAVALADGTSDGVLYPDIRAAIRYQRHNAKWYAYLRVGREACSVCMAASLLRLHRDADAAGLNFTDRDDASFGLELIPRVTREDNARML